ncbi:MAG TPA: peptidoglycan DD-metalloendopeptidase family protein [Candidatus Udaeobacter sp.]|nr:peptidoglycan DD-metalloendopeptidase family protein [Candidatus Udaeobacter sp.]
MSSEISASVGRWEKGARNLPADVSAVQQLLKSAAGILEAPEMDPKGVDGKISRPPATSDTVEAIEAFQSRFTSAVDGVVAPGSQTWVTLLAVVANMPTAPGNVTDVSQWLFPFPTVPIASWQEQPRAFASPRAGGARLHAGCDLYFPKGTPIHAVADGVVTRGPYPFYCGTFALEIDHGPFLARYGEIQSKTEVTAGATVKAGQKIASVGHLVGIRVPSDMLHFELYDKTMSGPLTVAIGSGSAMKNGVPFMRRKDLIDPTLKLNQWRENLPPRLSSPGG